jgi:hypothetical protein
VLGNASPGTSYTLLSTRGTSGQYLATDGLGVTSWESFEQASASYAEQFINGNATPTAFGMVNTYADILGTRITGNINGFTAQALSVTYTATPTKIFQLVCSISCLSDGLFAQNYFLSFFKNGVLVPEGTMHTKLDNNTATFPTNVTTCALLELATNDIITIKMKNSDSTQGVLVTDMNFTCIGVDGGGTTGGGGGGGETLQDVYDNTNPATILINDTNSSLSLQSNIGRIDSDVLRIRDNSGTSQLVIFDNGSLLANGTIVSGTALSSPTLDITGLVSLGAPPDVYTLPIDKTTATNGDFLIYNSLTSALEFGLPVVPYTFPTYSRLTDRTIVANALELPLTDGSPSLIVPAGFISPGDTFRIVSSGNIRFLNNVQLFSFKVYYGNPLSAGTLVAEIPLLSNAPVSQGSLGYYKFESIVVFRNTGASAPVADTSNFEMGLYKGQGYSSSTRTADTTIARDWYVSFQWGTNSASNEIIQSILTIEKI